MIAKNKSGWILHGYVNISEDEISNYTDVTGAYAIIRIKGKYLIGYNGWRKQWEFPAGGIEAGETARQAAIRELYEETHQKVDKLDFKGLFKVSDSHGRLKYQAVFYGEMEEMSEFVHTETDEMERIYLWDLQEDIGYVDECDKSIVERITR